MFVAGKFILSTPRPPRFSQLAHIERVVNEGLGKLLSERKEAFVPMVERLHCKVCVDLANSHDKRQHPVRPPVSHPSCLQRQSALSACVVVIIVVVIDDMAVNVVD